MQNQITLLAKTAAPAEMPALMFNGTLEGLFSAIFYAYENKLKNVSFMAATDNKQLSFFTSTQLVPTCPAHYMRIKNGILGLGYTGAEAYRDITYVFAAGEEGKNQAIFNFVRLLFSSGLKALGFLNHPDVVKFNEIKNRVNRELCRMRGFIHFRRTVQNVYYAEYEPDNNITKFLMPFFANRFNNQRFVINDVKRNLVGFYEPASRIKGGSLLQPDCCETAYGCTGWRVFPAQLKSAAQLEFDQKEETLIEMFNLYRKTINIAERRNKKLQLGFMPARYHKHMFFSPK